MHNGIANLQLGQVFQQTFGGAGALTFASAAGDRATCVKLGFGDDRELAIEIDEAGGERAGSELEPRTVIPALAGILRLELDPGLRRGDNKWPALQHARLQAIFH